VTQISEPTIRAGSMQGKRIRLRILERSDIVTTAAWINSDYISDIMGYPPTMPLAQQYDWFDKLKDDRSRLVFAICMREDGRHIGNAALGNIDYISRHAMFSIFIADPADQTQGLGTEAAKLLLGFAFNRLNLNKVHLRASTRFEAAIRMYEKLGFVKEGVMRQHYYANGVYEDKLIYSILRSEFRSANSSEL